MIIIFWIHYSSYSLYPFLPLAHCLSLFSLSISLSPLPHCLSLLFSLSLFSHSVTHFSLTLYYYIYKVTKDSFQNISLMGQAGVYICLTHSLFHSVFLSLSYKASLFSSHSFSSCIYFPNSFSLSALSFTNVLSLPRCLTICLYITLISPSHSLTLPSLQYLTLFYSFFQHFHLPLFGTLTLFYYLFSH